MIIEFLKPHALNMGQDYEYLATFCKGRGKLTIDKMRILVKGVNDGKELLLGLEGREGFFGRENSYQIIYMNVEEWITPDYLKTERKVYNYYRVRTDVADVDYFFTAWTNSDPMVHVGNLTHQFLTKIKNYKGSYKFNKKIY